MNVVFQGRRGAARAQRMRHKPKGKAISRRVVFEEPGHGHYRQVTSQGWSRGGISRVFRVARGMR